MNPDSRQLDGFHGTYNLRELNLEKNKIKYLEPQSFTSLVNLRVLNMEDNYLRSLAHFEPLVHLQIIKLGANRISDLSELDV